MCWYQLKKQGVLIAISKKLNWHTTRVSSRPEGQQTIVQGNMLCKHWALVGVYASQLPRKVFFQQLIKELVTGGGECAVMGDINVVMNDKLD